jgi:hypothetical protein
LIRGPRMKNLNFAVSELRVQVPSERLLTDC